MFNVLTLTRAIQKIGEAIPNLNTTIIGDVFELNSRPDIDYSVFAIVQEEHSIDEDFLHLRYVLYYIDRLLNDGSNRLEIQSHGLEILSLIINKIEELGLVINKDFNTTTFQPFHQRFSDECAGVYSRLEIQVPIDCTIPYDILVNPLLADLSTWEAGVYNPEDFGVDAFRTVTVSGQSLHYYTENEGDKTATIDNGYHNINVTKSGATYDGYQIVNTQTLSAYTYNKADTLNLCQYEIGQALSPVSAQTVTNRNDIATLSASTIALSAATVETTSALTNDLQTLSASTVELSGRTVTNTNDIATISAATSSNTVDIIILSGQTSANTGNINILSGLTSANTENIAILSAMTDDFVMKEPTLLECTTASTVDMNDLIESGYYYINSHNIQIANFVDFGGAWCANLLVHVIKKDVWEDALSGYSENIVQVATTPLTDGSTGVTTDYWPKRWYRIKGWNEAISGNGWSRWEEIATTTNAFMSDCQTVVGSSAHTIDFNEFVQKGGHYFCRTNGYSANGPRANLWEGILEVVWKFDANGLQRYTEMIDGVPHTYIRYRDWNDFSAWYEYTLTPVNQQ